MIEHLRFYPQRISAVEQRFLLHDGFGDDDRAG